MKIGYVISSECKASDIINSEAILRLHPFNKFFFIANNKGIISTSCGLNIVADTDFNSCPRLDVLVVAGLENNESDNIELLSFIKKQNRHTKYVLGIARGVEAIHNADLIGNKRVCSDSATCRYLENQGVKVSYEDSFIVDGKLISSGHSSGAIEATYALVGMLHGKWLGKFTEFYLEYEAKPQYPKLTNDPLPEPATSTPINVGVFGSTDVYLPDVVGAAEVLSQLPNSKIYYVSDSCDFSQSILNEGPTFSPNVTYQQCPELDVLIVGLTHPKYLVDENALDFIEKKTKQAEVIISVCGGTFLIGATGLLDGKRVTTNYHQKSILPVIGVEETDEKLLVDGKFISAGPAVGSYSAGLKAVEKIAGYYWAQYIEQEVLEFNPRPIWGVKLDTLGKRGRLISKLYSFLISRIFTFYLKKAKDYRKDEVD